jgi:hypothetical protein
MHVSPRKTYRLSRPHISQAILKQYIPPSLNLPTTTHMKMERGIWDTIPMA